MYRQLSHAEHDKNYKNDTLLSQMSCMERKQGLNLVLWITASPSQFVSEQFESSPMCCSQIRCPTAVTLNQTLKFVSQEDKVLIPNVFFRVIEQVYGDSLRETTSCSLTATFASFIPIQIMSCLSFWKWSAANRHAKASGPRNRRMAFCNWCEARAGGTQEH